jgi:hypothetical protein
MKKFSFILTVLVASTFVSCSLPTKLTNTATYSNVNVAEPVAAVFADLEVSPKKILFFYIPSQTVINAGEKNVVDSAVREALLANGNADVLVALEKQVKYDGNGAIESITVTGYPAKYVNFRSPGDDYLREISKGNAFAEKKDEGAAKLKLFK